MSSAEWPADPIAKVDQVQALANDLMALSICGYVHQLAGDPAEADAHLAQIVIRLRACSEQELFVLAGILLPHIGVLAHDLTMARMEAPA